MEGVSVSSEGTVGELKAALELATKVERKNQKLLFKGAILKDQDKLSDLGITAVPPPARHALTWHRTTCSC